MRINRIIKSIGAGLIGIVLISDFSNEGFCIPSNPLQNPVLVTRKEINDLIKENLEKEAFRICYEEWKHAIENPDSKQAHLLKSKARFIIDAPEKTKTYFSREDFDSYEKFWKICPLDISKLPFKNSNKEQKDFLMNCVFPVYLEMQLDIDITYGFAPKLINPETGEVKFSDRTIDYTNLKEGEKLLIYMHFKHNAKYFSEGGKRKPILKQ